ncbi:glycosyltransferase family 2 protein [Pseudooceanicola sp. CBS1P-1]|uniref:Glycosyltransferase family 2 protein n=1 Tax=Pseudooceanicola albus TaxID=2692189 RepID=A0A6L7G383_9RHOB|nr:MULTISPECIES: glycosyltransferase family 2 protein [Pseudooceanicola]MBT9382512.1 glycosyltransferase family 2 protein [Pseudooceanicola endophyticus]MXN17053.1 glycosyltransferase family 2 protein [Pseudooceanicola albus]
MSPRWGIVCTLKAPPERVLDFAAWHLELGATRLHLHFDDPADPALPLLRAHPRIRTVACDSGWWRRISGFRPKRHQARQTANATHCYRHKCRLDWLAHIDVDEFLLPEAPLPGLLAALPGDCHSARVHAIEALWSAVPEGDTVHFRAAHRDPAARRASSARSDPEFGAWLTGGLLSHTNGKIFARPGLPEAEFRIHNLLTPAGPNPGEVVLGRCALGHFHAGAPAHWLAQFRFRHARGSYRAELRPPRPGTPNLHAHLAALEAREGEAGLLRFHAATCRDTPELRRRLAAEGLLRCHEMPLTALRQRHFPHISMAPPENGP